MTDIQTDQSCTSKYEDEIDLLDLFNILWKRKILIVVIVTIASIGSVIYALSLDNIYESRAILKPASGSEGSAYSSIRNNLGPFAGMFLSGGGGGDPAADIYNSLNNIINNQKFISNIVKKNNLEHNLFENYDEMKSDETFKEHYDYKVFKSVSGISNLSQDQKSSYITLSVQHKDAKFAKRLVDILLLEASNHLAKAELKNIEQKIENYKREIANTTDITLKNRLSEVVAGLIQSKVLAKVQDYYGFTIISEPFVADSFDKMKPKRRVICILSFITSFIIAIFLSFFIEYINNIKKQSLDKIKESGS
ncbi:MAG: Wzz/FepE/Etk N-terminal domain-containing protein [bacterium]